MSDKHIVASFDRDLESIQALVMRMGGLVEQAIEKSAQALENKDVAIAEEVRSSDQQIDELREMINDECVRVLATRAPTAGDLRVVLSVMNISSNLERCGDFACNLAKRTMALSHLPAVSGTTGAIFGMTTQLSVMLKDALDAYSARDADKAQQVRHQDYRLDQTYEGLFREFLTLMMEDKSNITACLHYQFVAKNLERMGDHVTAIAEQVIYLATGKYPENERPKADQTSFFKEDVVG